MTKHHWEILKSGNIVVSNTAQELWENALSYFEWCDNHPIQSTSKVKVGKAAGEETNDSKPRAYHIKALCLHCGITEEYLKDLRDLKEKDSEYYIVASRILLVIYSQQYELAAVGELNPVFTARALNMDKDDNNSHGGVKVEIVGNLPALSRSENEILEKLDLEKSDIQEEEL